MSTVSQLGLMVAVFGLGSAISVTAGCELLLAHALAKAAAFMVVGMLDHQHGTRDTRLLPRPTPGWGPTMAITVVTAASMAGVPLVLGFIAKEEVLAAFDEARVGRHRSPWPPSSSGRRSALRTASASCSVRWAG